MTVNIQSINCVSNNLKLFGHRLYGLLQKKNIFCTKSMHRRHYEMKD